LATTIEALTSEIGILSTQTNELSEAIADVANFIQPVEAELPDVEKYLDDIGPEETSLRNRLRAQESVYAQVSLDSQRRRDELDNLRRQIEEDLGILVETDIVEAVETQQPLPLRPLVERLPTVTEISPNLENEIRQVRARKQRLGTVNPNALDEYNEAKERHTYLTSQASDLQEAATSLHTVIAELDELMTRDFTKTFRAIASEFKDYFSVLFGGGSARITLTEPEDPLSSGVEIIAKPPGKRQQSLNLLSGGERALIAAALVFAILKISPTPFCVLDEVDAMLDEANIERFRDTLCTLAKETQFILITHNRHTIEAAQTIYGISMGDDNTSVVVSLKLDTNEDSAADSGLRASEVIET
jgi:chromosome segregation protein